MTYYSIKPSVTVTHTPYTRYQQNINSDFSLKKRQNKSKVTLVQFEYQFSSLGRTLCVCVLQV